MTTIRKCLSFLPIAVAVVIVLSGVLIPALTRVRATGNTAGMNGLIHNVALSLTLAEEQHLAATVTGCASVSISGL